MLVSDDRGCAMATKTFSGRVDERRLAFADALTQERYGLSYGQYCSSILLDSIESAGALPSVSTPEPLSRKERSLAIMKKFSSTPGNRDVAAMSDRQIKDLIASRYE